MAVVSRIHHRVVNPVDVNYAIPEAIVNDSRMNFGNGVRAVWQRVLTGFGKRLREVRLEKAISQERLGDLAGLDRTYVSGVERGKHNVSLINIAKLAKALGVPIGTLFP